MVQLWCVTCLYGPQTSRWINSNLFSKIVELRGKECLTCLAWGQISQAKEVQSLIEESTGIEDKIFLSTCPNLECHNCTSKSWAEYKLTLFEVGISSL